MTIERYRRRARLTLALRGNTSARKCKALLGRGFCRTQADIRRCVRWPIWLQMLLVEQRTENATRYRDIASTACFRQNTANL